MALKDYDYSFNWINGILKTALSLPILSIVATTNLNWGSTDFLWVSLLLFILFSLKIERK